jgi:hypothetical protein
VTAGIGLMIRTILHGEAVADARSRNLRQTHGMPGGQSGGANKIRLPMYEAKFRSAVRAVALRTP